MTTPLLQLRGITKRFPGVLANNGIDLDLHKGEVLALLGENGAGKTTLMNILYGLYAPDEGEIVLRGEGVRIESPARAMKYGIGMVHQHFSLVPALTVLENLMLGAEQRRGPLLDEEGARGRLAELAARYGISVELSARVTELPVGQQQRVEILKALQREPAILILDEPTGVLTPQEVDDLFRVVRDLGAGGTAVILITHKLREVLAVADRMVVLRGGRLVGSAMRGEATEASLAELMVGRAIPASASQARAPCEGPQDKPFEGPQDRQAPPAQAPVLEVALEGVTFTVRAGEIAGVAGVEGNGQTELVEAITGLREVAPGSIRLTGQDLAGRDRRQVMELGGSYIPADRQRQGLVLGYTIADNLALCDYHRPPMAAGISLMVRAIMDHAARLMRAFDIRAGSVLTPMNNLSGGNQQKAVVARELSRPMKLLVAVQPTRGLDVASTEFVHRRLLETRDHGGAVLLVSTELDEVMTLSDRILVMYRGRIVADLPTTKATRQELGLLMAGASG